MSSWRGRTKVKRGEQLFFSRFFLLECCRNIFSCFRKFLSKSAKFEAKHPDSEKILGQNKKN